MTSVSTLTQSLEACLDSSTGGWRHRTSPKTLAMRGALPDAELERFLEEQVRINKLKSLDFHLPLQPRQEGRGLTDEELKLIHNRI